MQWDGLTFNLLYLRAIYLEELGDLARAESVYRQAEWPTAGFNLALFLHRNKRHQEALEVVDQVKERSPQPAYLVLKGDIVAALGQQATARLLHQDAISRVVDPTKQSVWSLGWLARCASSLGHDDLALKFRAASTAQIEAEEDSALEGALLPERGDGANEMRAAA